MEKLKNFYESPDFHLRGPAAPADSSQSQDSQTMAVFAKKQTALFPRWKGSKDLPKVDGACLKMRIFHASANKVTISSTQRDRLCCPKLSPAPVEQVGLRSYRSPPQHPQMHGQVSIEGMDAPL